MDALSKPGEDCCYVRTYVHVVIATVLYVHVQVYVQILSENLAGFFFLDIRMLTIQKCCYFYCEQCTCMLEGLDIHVYSVQQQFILFHKSRSASKKSRRAWLNTTPIRVLALLINCAAYLHTHIQCIHVHLLS